MGICISEVVLVHNNYLHELQAFITCIPVCGWIHMQAYTSLAGQPPSTFWECGRGLARETRFIQGRNHLPGVYRHPKAYMCVSSVPAPSTVCLTSSKQAARVGMHTHLANIDNLHWLCL